MATCIVARSGAVKQSALQLLLDSYTHTPTILQLAALHAFFGFWLRSSVVEGEKLTYQAITAPGVTAAQRLGGAFVGKKGFIFQLFSSIKCSSHCVVCLFPGQFVSSSHGRRFFSTSCPPSARKKHTLSLSRPDLRVFACAVVSRFTFGISEC